MREKKPAQPSGAGITPYMADKKVIAPYMADRKGVRNQGGWGCHAEREAASNAEGRNGERKRVYKKIPHCCGIFEIARFRDFEIS